MNENDTYLHYILKDHLGSWTTITDAEGNVEQELSFDAWGNLRDPETWTGTSTEASMFDRGFTGHEHLRFFDLINMNGRMYDPVMSSFLSVDAYVQSPDNSQNFNRYAYCLNNPLRYTDPTGWYCQGWHTGTPAQGPYECQWNSPLEPRDLGMHQLPDIPNPDILWMEANDQKGGAGGGTSGNNGGYYDQYGNYLGSNGNDDGRIYVVRSEIAEVKSQMRNIKRFFKGKNSTISADGIQQYFIEIESSKENRQRMYEIVSKDDGSGGTADSNNREYGGYIDNAIVVETAPGPVADPSTSAFASFTLQIGHPTFHSHPSGDRDSYIDANGYEHIPCFSPGPSPQDIEAAGEHTCYVFDRRYNYVYIYNGNGIQSKMYYTAFINRL